MTTSTATSTAAVHASGAVKARTGSGTSARATLARADWEALGTSVVLLVDDPAALAMARAIVERELRAIDRACSRFRPDSDLERANAGAGRFVGVDPLLIEAVEVALRAAALTDGDVDPTVGNALILAGYDRDWTLLESPRSSSGSLPPEDVAQPAITVRVTPGWRAIELDRERAAIRVPTGVRLDLGATAKAWVADRAAAAVYEATGAGSLIGLGGDIATAGASPEEGWRIYVTDDHRRAPGEQGQMISIRCGGIATSSTTARRWRHEERTQHHIVDPATGVPVASRWRTSPAPARWSARTRPRPGSSSWGCPPAWWAMTAPCALLASGRHRRGSYDDRPARRGRSQHVLVPDALDRRRGAAVADR
jgi:thiamine biosynthesis lipoprotein